MRILLVLFLLLLPVTHAQKLVTDLKDPGTLKMLKGLIAKNAKDLAAGLNGAVLNVHSEERKLGLLVSISPTFFTPQNSEEAIWKKKGILPFYYLKNSIFFRGRMKRDLDSYNLTPFMSIYLYEGKAAYQLSFNMRHYNSLRNSSIETVDSRWLPTGLAYWWTPGKNTPIPVGQFENCPEYETCAVKLYLDPTLDLRTPEVMPKVKKLLGL